MGKETNSCEKVGCHACCIDLFLNVHAGELRACFPQAVRLKDEEILNGTEDDGVYYCVVNQNKISVRVNGTCPNWDKGCLKNSIKPMACYYYLFGSEDCAEARERFGLPPVKSKTKEATNQ